jgi:hypothetical protein
MFVVLARTLAARIRCAAALLRAFALLEDGADRRPDRSLIALRPPDVDAEPPLHRATLPQAARDAAAPPAHEPFALRQSRVPHAHRVPPNALRRPRRPGTIRPRPALCLTPVHSTAHSRPSGTPAEGHRHSCTPRHDVEGSDHAST